MYQKYVVSINFDLCLGYVLDIPYNKQYMVKLIADDVVVSYAEDVSQQQATIIINANDIAAVNAVIKGSPLAQYWQCQISEMPAENTENTTNLA